jgi:hypothetical protein
MKILHQFFLQYENQDQQRMVAFIERIHLTQGDRQGVKQDTKKNRIHDKKNGRDVITNHSKKKIIETYKGLHGSYGGCVH